MGPVRATCERTLGRTNGLFSTVFAVGSFLAATALLLARGIEAAEGGSLSLSVVWALSVSPVLPVLAAVLAMDVWSDERQTGRLSSLLSIAVRERDFVLGKFLGIVVLLLAVVLLSLVSTLVSLRLLSPGALTGVRLAALGYALFAVAVQGVLWTAVSVAASALFRHAASAACASVLVLVAAPRGLWAVLLSCADSGRMAFGEFPLDAHVVDIASGVVPMGTVGLYLVLTAVFLFCATKFVVFARLVGCGAAGLRMSTAFTVFLSFVVGCLCVLLLTLANPVVELPGLGGRAELTSRTRSILAESSGTLTITSFLSRKDPSARAVGRMLRSLQRTSEAVGGARIELRFVDPRWDIGASERLVSKGVVENSLVFEKGRRTVSLPMADGFGERLCAATVRRISSPPRKRNVYWTVGHGENRFDDYGAFGMSDIARDLFREGFSHATIDLSDDKPVPADCALLLIAGARDDFSRAEADRLNAYLRDGGRLLLLVRSSKSGGVTSLLPSWGLRPHDRVLDKVRTLSGTDVIVTDFAEHPISAPLRGSRILLERPVFFAPSSVVASGTGVDRIGFSPVAEVGSAAVVAAIEQGGGAGTDLAVRPTRLVVIGDAGFVINGQLTARACANRDFFLNCIAYLSGSEAHGSGEDDPDTFTSGLDRSGRLRLTVWTVAVLPFGVMLIQLLFVVRRRRRR